MAGALCEEDPVVCSHDRPLIEGAVADEAEGGTLNLIGWKDGVGLDAA